MGQLVQFSTLDQVTGIYNILAQGAGASSTTAAYAALRTADREGRVRLIDGLVNRFTIYLNRYFGHTGPVRKKTFKEN